MYLCVSTVVRKNIQLRSIKENNNVYTRNGILILSCRFVLLFRSTLIDEEGPRLKNFFIIEMFYKDILVRLEEYNSDVNDTEECWIS